MAKTPSFSEIEGDSSKPRSRWDTILVTTPVILTVMATILAGLSSSEMTASQFYRSFAAQWQSKASDQWGYFQAKKLRAELSNNTSSILRGISQAMPMDDQDLSESGARLMSQMQRVVLAINNSEHPAPAVAAISKELSLRANTVAGLCAQLSRGTTRPDGVDEMASFTRGDLPTVLDQPVGDQGITDMLKDISANLPSDDLEHESGKITQKSIDQAISTANENLNVFDKAVDDVNQGYTQLEKTCTGISSEGAAFERATRRAPDEVVGTLPASAISGIGDLCSQLSIGINIARLNFNANRYQREAQYNQVLGQLYELEVRRQSYTSDRHRERSKEFFYGMLGAQAGVTISTFALAVRRKSLLWALAAAAGLLAILFGAYVYLFV